MTGDLAADLVLALHVLFVVFAVGGLELLLAGLVLGWSWVRKPAFRNLHLAALLFVATRAMLGIPCPLTQLEAALRSPVAPETPARRLAHKAVFAGQDEERFRRSATAAALLAVGLYGLAGPGWLTLSIRPVRRTSSRANEA